MGKSIHNPQNLSPDQFGGPDGYRLLSVEEFAVLSDPISAKTELGAELKARLNPQFYSEGLCRWAPTSLESGRLSDGLSYRTSSPELPATIPVQARSEEFRSLEYLVRKVEDWGIEKGIIGEGGKGTLKGQANKMFEECNETRDAALLIAAGCPDSGLPDELKDGIGDTAVTLILLAKIAGMTLAECLGAAYDVISKRTGKMVNGTFVKDAP